MLIDSHCHLTYQQLACRIDQVIESSKQAGVKGWVTVGTDHQHWHTAIEMARRFDRMYVAVGLHPHYAAQATAADLELIEGLVAHEPKVCAIGETGLDQRYQPPSIAEQAKVFSWQIDLASRLCLPLIVHCREAFDQTFELIRSARQRLGNVIIHCFTGGPEQAILAMDLDLYLSFSGIVTFKNADYIRQALRHVRPDRILVETDCPYLSPEPLRATKVNEPAFMINTVNHMAQVLGLPVQQMAELLTNNTIQAFGPRTQQWGI